MKANVGKTDRVIRILLGGIIIIAGILYNSWWGAIGAIPFLTGLMKWCPLYSLLKVSTRKEEVEE
ncbi:DUF2892 domain-containing protein [Fidelibacter multiformis]|jgi:hypothetical protein|uniref:YgaP family membrane protein n=1 Tax=Fidelibacter multiformis TaxID=3377529 RepID=UPI0037DD93C6